MTSDEFTLLKEGQVIIHRYRGELTMVIEAIYRYSLVGRVVYTDSKSNRYFGAAWVIFTKEHMDVELIG